jgi:TRAP-type uncharacterized transport system substrate-binding protein
MFQISHIFSLSYLLDKGVSIGIYIFLILVLYYAYKLNLFKKIVNLLNIFDKHSENDIIKTIQKNIQSIQSPSSSHYNYKKIGVGRVYHYENDSFYPFFNQYILPCERQRTYGSVDTIIKLLNNKLDYGFVDENIFLNFIKNDPYIFNYLLRNKRYSNYKNILIYPKIAKTNLQTVCCLYHKPLFILAKQFTPLTNFKYSSLSKSKIAVFDERSDDYYYLIKFLKLQNVSTKIIVTYSSESQMINDFRRNKDIHGIFYSSLYRNKKLESRLGNMKVRVITPRMNLKHFNKNETTDYQSNEKTHKHILQVQFPLLFKSTINLNDFYTNINMTNFANTYTSRVLLISRYDNTEDEVYEITKKIIQNTNNLKDNLNVFYNQSTDSTDSLESKNVRNSDDYIYHKHNKSFDLNEYATPHQEITLHSGAKKIYYELDLLGQK